MTKTIQLKEKLKIKSEQERKGLLDELSVLGAKSERIVTTTLLVGGSLAVAYFIYKRLTAEDEEGSGESKFSKIVDNITDNIGDHLTNLFLNTAKQKLIEFLESYDKEDSE